MPLLEAGGGDDPAANAARLRMVDEQIAGRGVRNEDVLRAMREVPRHLFVPEDLRPQAYDDHPLQIGHGQTISQPFIVALMTALARPARTDRALEIGTGCGYQAAVLSRLVAHVFSVEVDAALHHDAARRLLELGYVDITCIRADGREGWPEAAPYDIVLVTAAPEEVPAALLAQLRPGGRLVIPVGRDYQELRLIEKDAEGRTKTSVAAQVMFVPMVRGGRGPGVPSAGQRPSSLRRE